RRPRAAAGSGRRRSLRTRPGRAAEHAATGTTPRLCRAMVRARGHRAGRDRPAALPESSTMNHLTRARRRAQLLLIAALFLLPFVIAVVLRFGGWEPPRTRNFGELLEPPLPMHAVQARTTQGEPWRF